MVGAAQTVETAAANNEDYPLYETDDESDEDDAFEEVRRVGGWPYYAALARRASRMEAVSTAAKDAPPPPGAWPASERRPGALGLGGLPGALSRGACVSPMWRLRTRRLGK